MHLSWFWWISYSSFRTLKTISLEGTSNQFTDSKFLRCVDNANVTVNVGDACFGWKDLDSCQGDGRCNEVHTSYGNVLLRLLASSGIIRPFDVFCLLLIMSAAGGLIWSLRSSLGFLSEVITPSTSQAARQFALTMLFPIKVVKPERRALAAYPVCLFFAAIAWMIMLRTSSSERLSVAVMCARWWMRTCMARTGRPSRPRMVRRTRLARSSARVAQGAARGQ